MTKKDCLFIIVKGYLITFLLCLMPADVFAFPYKGIELKINSSISEMYDDNINFSKDDKEKDFITTLGLGMNAAYEGQRRSLNLEGRIAQRFHAKFKDIKSSTQNLNLNFHNEFSEFDSIGLTYGFSHSFTPATFEEEFGRVKARQETYNNNIDFSYTKDLSEYLGFIMRYNHHWSILSPEEEDKSEFSQNTLGGTLNYLPSIYTTLSLSFTTLRSNSNISINRTDVGIRQHITQRLYFDGKFGINISDSDEGKDISQYINVLLNNEIDERTNINLSFTRDEESIPESDDVFSNWQAQAEMQHRPAEKIIGSFSGFYGQGTFSGTDVTNKFTGATLTLQYEISEHLKASVNYSFTDFNSTDGTNDYYHNLFSSGLSMVY